MRRAEELAAVGTPEEFAEACLPSSNWVGDEWKSRRESIARMVQLRDAYQYGEGRAEALEDMEP